MYRGDFDLVVFVELLTKWKGDSGEESAEGWNDSFFNGCDAGGPNKGFRDDPYEGVFDPIVIVELLSGLAVGSDEERVEGIGDNFCDGRIVSGFVGRIVDSRGGNCGMTEGEWERTGLSGKG